MQKENELKLSILYFNDLMCLIASKEMVQNLIVVDSFLLGKLEPKILFRNFKILLKISAEILDW